MTGFESILVGVMLIGLISFIIYKGKVNMEIKLLHNRINAMADEVKRLMDNNQRELTYIAKNAQGIASNALSSAQRAESKINKLTEDKVNG